MSEIKVYTRFGCPFCAKLVKILKERKIPFQEIDVNKNPEIKNKIITRDEHTPVPQVEYKGRIIFDYTTEEDLVDEIEKWIKS